MEITPQNFYGNTNPVELVKKYSSPLYLYNESILRQRCREIKRLLTYPHYTVNYSAKANCNLTLLRIIKEEGLNVDAMSPGEIYIELQAGFKPEQILYICNNVSADELQYAIDAGVNISVDSLAQLELFGKINPEGCIVVRFNPGIGAGHHQKTVTGGKGTKFGIQSKSIPEVKQLLKKYDLHLIGINQHIGSLFMESTPYLIATRSLLAIADNFENLEFIDLGGGFGIPYREKEHRLNLRELGSQVDHVIAEWVRHSGKDVTFQVEPGRYIVAESGILLGKVYAAKINYDTKYIGTDLGFNVLMRRVLYDSVSHSIEIYKDTYGDSVRQEEVTIVGNICETGDIIAQNRLLPEIGEGDILGVLDVGAYGYSMSSNYNSRLRPAEVLIRENGEDVLIRKREAPEDLMRTFP